MGRLAVRSPCGALTGMQRFFSVFFTGCGPLPALHGLRKDFLPFFSPDADPSRLYMGSARIFYRFFSRMQTPPGSAWAPHVGAVRGALTLEAAAVACGCTVRASRSPPHATAVSVHAARP